jgi:hypothetical protein
MELYFSLLSLERKGVFLFSFSFFIYPLVYTVQRISFICNLRRTRSGRRLIHIHKQLSTFPAEGVYMIYFLLFTPGCRL